MAGLISVLSAQTIVVAGSDTMGASLLPKLKEAYLKDYPEIKIDLITEGSRVAFEQLLAGTVQLGMSSRPVNRKEEIAFLAKGLRLMEHPGAWDMLCVIVHEDNPLANLTLKQVESIFAGDIVGWDELQGKTGRIDVFTRQPISGTFRSFQELGVAGRDYRDDATQLAGNKEIAEAVAKNPRAIGYVGHAYLDRKGIRALKVDSISPDAENKAQFPLSRRLYYYTVGEPTGEVRRFLDWAIQSEKAQAVIKEVGFFPLDQ